MGSFKIIKNKTEWGNVLSKVDCYDFYHTFDYHDLSKKINETPILITYEQGEKLIAIPFLYRGIYNTNYYDLTSVYGYAGPLTKNIQSDFDNNIFTQELKNFFLEKKNCFYFFKTISLFEKSRHSFKECW